MQKVRIHKYLADIGVASRRAIEEMILEGRITVNSQAIRKLPCFVEIGGDQIRVDGRLIKAKHSNKVYFLLNKPRGVVCTASDPRGRPRAVDLVPKVGQRIYCVGRLDEDSTGIIVMTNDGELTQKLTHPSYEVPKTYVVEVEGMIEHADMQKLKSGMFLDGKRTKAARVRVLKKGFKRSVLEIQLSEGRNREIRRMLSRLGHEVQRLKRTAIGRIVDRGLKIGSCRQLTPTEVRQLKKYVETAPDARPSPPRAAAARQTSASMTARKFPGRPGSGKALAAGRKAAGRKAASERAAAKSETSKSARGEKTASTRSDARPTRARSTDKRSDAKPARRPAGKNAPTRKPTGKPTGKKYATARPTGAKKATARPARGKSTDKRADAKPARRPAGKKTASTRSDARPTRKPIGKPTGKKYATSKPTRKPAAKRSATGKPTGKKYAAPKPTRKPAAKRSATGKPTGKKYAAPKPTRKPAAKRSATGKPTGKKYATSKPTRKPAAKRSATGKPTGKKYATAKPTRKPAAKRSATGKPTGAKKAAPRPRVTKSSGGGIIRRGKPTRPKQR